MSTTEDRSSDASGTASVGRVDMKLEVVVIPVSDVDGAKEFYGRLGWRLDADRTGDDFRLIQFTPPGSGCSVQFGTNITSVVPGSAQDLRLIVSDIEAAHDELVGAVSRSARCSTVQRGSLVGIGTPARIVASTGPRPIAPATAPSPRSATRTATAGCSRK